MCGITGVIDYGKDISVQTGIIEAMMQTLSHRGPDDAGFYADKHVMLGHRRLIVIDPAGGASPCRKATAATII